MQYWLHRYMATLCMDSSGIVLVMDVYGESLVLTKGDSEWFVGIELPRWPLNVFYLTIRQSCPEVTCLCSNSAAAVRGAERHRKCPALELNAGHLSGPGPEWKFTAHTVTRRTPFPFAEEGCIIRLIQKGAYNLISCANTYRSREVIETVSAVSVQTQLWRKIWGLFYFLSFSLFFVLFVSIHTHVPSAQSLLELRIWLLSNHTSPLCCFSPVSLNDRIKMR